MERQGTITLSFIASTQNEADKLIRDWGSYFDDVQYRVGHTKNFASARNVVLKKIKTDYWFWMDTDDTLEGIQNLREVLAGMQDKNIDVVDLEYLYAFNEQGECITTQWRERIVKTDPQFHWKGRVHETVLSERPVKRVKNSSIRLRHAYKTQEDALRSTERNHKLLLKDWEEDKDPRTAHYLGLSYFTKKDWDNAIKYFIEHVKTSGWEEEQYRSWLYVGQAHNFAGNTLKAQKALNEAIELMPERPDAYFYKGQFYNGTKEYDKAIEWIRVGREKSVPEDTLSAIDMTLYTYKPLVDGAIALLNLGDVKEAYAWFKTARKISPDNPAIEDLKPLFEETYGETIAVERAKWLMKYTGLTKGRPLEILKALPTDLAADPRFNPERAKYTPKKVWGDNSIVFFSGVAPEPWGPDKMENGIGGSEEAVIYLSRELVKLGWDVTVFCDRETEYEDDGVHWKPWTLMNPYDTFNIYVAWRNPFLSHGIKAKHILTDIHDVIPERQVTGSLPWIDKYMVKSNYHRNLYPDVPDDKFQVIGNGIVKKQFARNLPHGGDPKRPYSVGYFSSYNRGLECLLDMWSSIRKEVPQATLDIYYGWDSFDSINEGNPAMMQWKAKMLIKLGRLKSQGVSEHGRVSHTELAEAMEAVKVWAYPTEFTEIHCITALKAQEAGCVPVYTKVGALPETVAQDTYEVDSQDIYTNKQAQNEFINYVTLAFEENETLPRPYTANRYWTDVAKVWDDTIRSLS